MSGADPSAIKSALKLEDLRFSQSRSERAKKMDEETKAFQRQMTSRGLFNSGPRLKGEVDIAFKSLELAIDDAVATRKELGRRVPELLEPENLQPLEEKLGRSADNTLAALLGRFSREWRFGVSAKSAISREGEMWVASIKGKVKSELAAIPLEVNLGMHRKPEPQFPVNISNSTIAALNLGTVMGDLNGSIGDLSRTGHEQIAQSIKQLAEAVSASRDLDSTAKKEVLEHVALVSTEAALPEEKRKMGPFRMSVAAINTCLTTAGQLLTIWNGVEQALKTAGIVH